MNVNLHSRRGISDKDGIAETMDSTGVLEGNEARVIWGSKEGYESVECSEGTGARIMDLRADASEGEGTSHIAMPEREKMI